MLRYLVIFAGCVCFVLSESAHQLCDSVALLDCSSDYVPYETDERVCGTNGVTYNNFCEYSQARCKTPTIHIASIGDCSAPRTTAITMAVTTSGAPPVTATTAAAAGSTNPPSGVITTPASAAGTTTVGTTTVDTVLQVFCASKDAITCPPSLDPICGTDKNFYLNQCEFTKARCDNAGLVKADIASCTPSTGK